MLVMMSCNGHRAHAAGESEVQSDREGACSDQEAERARLGHKAHKTAVEGAAACPKVTYVRLPGLDGPADKQVCARTHC